MTSDRELDRILTRWLSSVSTDVPQRYVREALVEISMTPQRSADGPFELIRQRLERRRGILVVLGVAVTLLAAAIGLGTLNQTVVPSPSGQPSARPTVAASPLVTTTKRLSVSNRGMDLRVPTTWEVVDAGCCEGIIVVRGTDPVGMISVFHGSASNAALCDSECVALDVPTVLPFSEQKVIGLLSAAVEKHAGSSDWTSASGLNARIQEARRVTVSSTRAGTLERHVYVIGRYLTGAIVIAVTVPEAEGAGALVERLLQGLEPYPGLLDPVGTPIEHASRELGFEVKIPDVWPRQPDPMLGTASFGEGTVTISVAADDARLAICDPSCRVVSPVDLAALEGTAFAARGPGIAVGDTELAGVPARYQRRDATSGARSFRVISMIDGKLVHLWIDLRDPGIEFSVAADVVASFEYVRPPSSTVIDGVLIGDGFEIRLPTGVKPGDGPGGIKIDVTTGDALGRFWVCGWSGFSTTKIPCWIRQATTLQALAAVVPNLRGFAVKDQAGEIDGEPMLVSYVDTYEYPANGGQWLAYIVAVHEGKPYVIRLHNRLNSALHVDEVIEAFRFTN